jgi:hypothetical protein
MATDIQSAAGGTPQGGVGQPQSQAQGPQPTPQPGQSAEEPKWLSQIGDTALREEAKQQYMLHKGFTQKTQEYSEEKKKWENEKRTYEDGLKKYQDYARQVQDYLAAQQQPGRQAQPQQPPQVQQVQQAAAKAFEHWEYMAPQEQARTMSEHLIRTVAPVVYSALYQNVVQNAVQPYAEYFSRYLGLFTDAVSRKVEDPTYDMNGYLKTLLELNNGQANMTELAHKLTTEKRSQEERERKIREQAIAEYKAEQEKLAQPAGIMGSGTPISLRNMGSAQDRERALNEELTKRHGANIWGTG